MTDWKLPPGPPAAKNIFAIVRAMSEFERDFLGVLGRHRRQYGDIFMMQFGNMRQYMVSHPDYLHQVLVSDATKLYKDDGYKNPHKGMARFLGNGILTSDGEFWRRQRKLVAPALHTKRIANYAQTTVDYATEMLDGWRDGAQVDMSREMMRVTMKIVARTLFNTTVEGETDKVNAAINVFQHFSSEHSLMPTWVPTPRELRVRRARRDLDATIYRFIGEWREKREDKGDLLSMLLLAEDEDGEHMTDEQARDEAVTLFVAGHETTANAMSWTWYLLTQHPEVEAKLHAELDTVLGGRPPTLADLEHLKYTEMVIKESMRLYPPAWGVGREAIEDLQIGGYDAPKGTVIFANIYFTHRDPRWWDEPEAFRPERFSPENEPKIPKYAYIPFGGGPRICVGNAFATMETRLLLATIASRFRPTLKPGTVVEAQPLITLNPKGVMPMTLVAREPVRELAL
jgi:cytochrome P450